MSYPVNQNDASATVAVATSNASLSLDGKNEAQIQAANKEKFENFFKKLAKYILTIESPSFHKLESVTDSNSNSNSLIKLLIQPLEKRFKFHFCTSRKTNNLDKVCYCFPFRKLKTLKSKYIIFLNNFSPNGIFLKSCNGSKTKVNL